MEPDKYCYEHKHYYEPSKVCEKCAAERRAVYERAYFAALTGFCSAQPIPGVIDFDPAHNAKWVALETVRQWPSMQAELEQEIAK